MRRSTLLCLPLLAATALAQETPPPAPAAPAPPVPIERPGYLVPADVAELSLWPEAFGGELLVLEVTPHGSPVNEGDILVRLDTTRIDEQIRQAEFNLAQAVERTRFAEEEQRLGDEATEAELARADKDLEWARRRLQGFLEQEKAHRQEQDRLHDQSGQAGIDDQADELTQLEKMYKEDELVDATEEIVLRRARRGLAQTRAGVELGRRQRAHQRELADAIAEEGMRLDVEHKARAFERQRKSVQLKRQGRELDVQRTRRDLDEQRAALQKLGRDRQLMLVRAPRRGLFLHGSARATPGSARLEKGSGLPPRRPFAVVADPDRLEVLTDVLEADLARVKSGAAARVVPAAVKELELLGACRVAALPSGRKDESTNTYEVVIPLEQRDLRLRPGMCCKVSFGAAAAGEPGR